MKCPYTLPASYRPAYDIKAPVVTTNGASTTGALTVKRDGTIDVGNLGSSGSGDVRTGFISFPAGM